MSCQSPNSPGQALNCDSYVDGDVCQLSVPLGAVSQPFGNTPGPGKPPLEPTVTVSWPEPLPKLFEHDIENVVVDVRLVAVKEPVELVTLTLAQPVVPPPVVLQVLNPLVTFQLMLELSPELTLSGFALIVTTGGSPVGGPHTRSPLELVAITSPLVLSI